MADPMTNSISEATLADARKAFRDAYFNADSDDKLDSALRKIHAIMSRASQPVDTGVERKWEPHERNYSGGRFGVWHTDDWTMLRVEAGVGDVTASIRANEAWDLGLRLSPALAKRVDYLFSEMKKAQAALHAFTWADTLAPTLRKVADEWDCGNGCERAGSSTCHEREDGCRFVEAEEMRQFADALELAAQLREQPITPPLDSEAVERARVINGQLYWAATVAVADEKQRALLLNWHAENEALLFLAKPIRTGRLPTSADVGVAKPVGGERERKLEAIAIFRAMFPHNAKAQSLADEAVAALTAMKEDDRG